ncbi:MAG: penicillin-binding protein 1C [Candidatus Aminicenantes bacterium]|nr:MAG: penicillin-binding protein 1C [Candidatus Aminicenantes bacterium]
MNEKVKKIVLMTILFVPILFSASLYLPFPKGKLKPAPVVSLSLVDRKNTVLREILSEEGGHCHWVTLEEVSTDLLKATLVAEDRYFYLHPGINPFAIIRALFQNIRRGQVVSGASTISQQVVRNIYRKRRNLFAKMHEIWLAIRMERTISKDNIFTQYLNRIYYGNQAYGIGAASRLYFDKSPADLSLAEGAFLAGLPRSPSTHNPYSHFAQAKKRQEQILYQMFIRGYIPSAKWERAKAESLRLIPAKQNFRAPHFCDFILQKIPMSQKRMLSRIQTSCDYALQEKVEKLVGDHIQSLENKSITNAAVIIMDNATGEILSMVGSKDFFNNRHDGQVNGAVSLRQPGSTLKPFTYGLALERGMTAAELLEDKDYYFLTPDGSYSPRNYDNKFHGKVRLRQALACSYNVPAVTLLDKLGTDLLFQRLKMMDFESLDKSPSHYGVGLTLGNGEVTLLELTRAYSALAREGIYVEDRSILKCFDTQEREIIWDRQEISRRIFSPQIAYLLTDILADKDARVPAFGYLSPLNLPFECAVKTGTSADFRDNWTVGYTPKYTVGVWVGNFDATPMFNISGVTGCGPLFKDIMLLLESKNVEVNFSRAEDVIKVKICPLSGNLATEHCPGIMEDIFIEGSEPQEFCSLHTETESPVSIPFNREEEFEIAFPLDNDVFKMDPILRRSFQRIKLKTNIPDETSIDSVEWWVGNQKIGDVPSPFSLYWNMKPGLHRIRAVAFKGKNRLKSSSVTIKVEE